MFHSDEGERQLAGHRTPSCACTRCDRPIDRASQLDGAAEAPIEGDLSICLHCGHVMMFKADLTVRDLSDREACEVAADRLAVAVIRRIQRARKRLGLVTKESLH